MVAGGDEGRGELCSSGCSDGWVGGRQGSVVRCNVEMLRWYAVPIDGWCVKRGRGRTREEKRRGR
jgi:hypothetical protein